MIRRPVLDLRYSRFEMEYTHAYFRKFKLVKSIFLDLEMIIFGND